MVNHLGALLTLMRGYQLGKDCKSVWLIVIKSPAPMPIQPSLVSKFSDVHFPLAFSIASANS